MPLLSISQMADRLIEKIVGYSDLYTIGQDPNTEHVVAAAWLSPGGNIYAGDSHYDAAREAAQDGNAEAIRVFSNGGRDGFHDRFHFLHWQDGFLTNQDQFITREEALILAKRQRQLKIKVEPERDWAASEDFR